MSINPRLKTSIIYLSKPTETQLADTVEEGCIILEPQQIDNNGIVAYLPEENKLIYGYEELIIAYADTNCSIDEAIDHIQYNTLRAMPYIPSHQRPVIVFNAPALRLAHDNSIAEMSEIEWMKISLEYSSEWSDENIEQLNSLSLFN